GQDSPLRRRQLGSGLYPQRSETGREGGDCLLLQRCRRQGAIHCSNDLAAVTCPDPRATDLTGASSCFLWPAPGGVVRPGLRRTRETWPRSGWHYPRMQFFICPRTCHENWGTSEKKDS